MPQTPDETVASQVRKALQEVYAQNDDVEYQREWPQSDPKVSTPPADRPGNSFDPTVVWVVLGALTLALLVVLIARILSRRASREHQSPAPKGISPAPSPGPRPAEPNVIDDLAKAGRYGEAVHVLLLQALHPLLSRHERGTALTSTEVAQSLQCEPKERQALDALIRVAEAAHFGNRSLGRDDYEAACAHAVTLRALQPTPSAR